MVGGAMVGKSSELPAASETLARLRRADPKRPQLDWDYARVQYGIEKHPFVRHPNDAELLQLQVLHQPRRGQRSQLSELQWQQREWPRLLAPLRHYLNNKPRQLLKNMAPIELALGIPRESSQLSELQWQQREWLIFLYS
jgi:hypothetical protein